MSDGIEADVKAAAKAAIKTKKVSEAIDLLNKTHETIDLFNDGGETRDLINDGEIATAALIDDSDKIVGIDNGDAHIGGASIDSVMDDGSFVNAYFIDGGDFVRKRNFNGDFSDLYQATVVETTYSAPKKS